MLSRMDSRGSFLPSSNPQHLLQFSHHTVAMLITLFQTSTSAAVELKNPIVDMCEATKATKAARQGPLIQVVRGQVLLWSHHHLLVTWTRLF